MGRILVWWFLGSLAFAVVTFFVGIGLGFLALGDALQGHGVAWRLVPWGSSLPMVWLFWGVVYLLWIIPIIVVLFLGVSALRRSEPPAPLPAQWAEWRSASISVVLTAYNDEAAIGPAVDEFRRVPRVDRVIVIDNNCTDRTAEVARTHGAEVVAESRQGYGFACLRGLHYSLEHTRSEIIALTEGDMTFFADDLEKMVPYLSDCELVLGTRTTHTLTQPGSQMDWFMAWGNLLLAFLIRLRYWDRVFLGRVQLTDVGCTFRVIRRPTLARILDQLTVGGHDFSPHMILVALHNDVRIIELPVKFRQRVGISKGAGGSRWRAVNIGLSMIHEISVH